MEKNKNVYLDLSTVRFCLCLFVLRFYGPVNPMGSCRLIVFGFTTLQPLWIILCRLPEKGRKEIEEIVEEIKERNREERGFDCVGV